jgi:hypothetical protein
MTEQQKQYFEAYAILRAHTQLFVQMVDQATTADLQAQLAQVQAALTRVASLPEIQKAA